MTDTPTESLRSQQSPANARPLPGNDSAAPIFTHPDEVLGHPALGLNVKRALLAGWASDACAVEGKPALRQIPQSGAVVPVDEILQALCRLDGSPRGRAQP